MGWQWQRRESEANGVILNAEKQRTNRCGTQKAKEKHKIRGRKVIHYPNWEYPKAREERLKLLEL